MPTNPERIQDVFLAASELSNPVERARHLDAACAGDAVMRERVEALLRAHEQPDSLLDQPSISTSEAQHAATRSFAKPENPGNGETFAQGEAVEDDREDALGFLDPPRRTDSLGRLGQYEVLEVLGKGGFGVVFRAFDDVLQRVVAVKVLAPSLATTSPARKRFIREAQSAAPIQHENVVRVHTVGESPLPYLVMEFIDGETLQERLDRIGPLELTDVLRIGRQIAEGLAAAHEKGLIHRDIKPSNILIEEGSQFAKITDFGLARAADDASLTRSGVVAGTPMYMAPEQARGETLDHRADLFSLGSVLYAMLTGRPPFRAETTLAVLKRVAEDTPRPIREVIPEVPEWLCRIVEKLHAKKPEDRFSSAKEVAEVLADCEKQLQTHQVLKDLSRIPERKRERRERPVRSTAGVLVLVVLLGGLGIVVLAGVGMLMFLMPATDVVTPGIPTTVTERAGDTLPAENGWVQLFNGKDLTGWKPNMNWKVVDGVLTSVAVGLGSNLESARDDFENFHLRVEARINKGGNSGIFVRSPRGEFNPDFYEVEITGVDEAAVKTGGLWHLGNENIDAGPPPEPGDWFTMVVKAAGNELTVTVNGRETAHWTDAGGKYRKGALDLQQNGNAIVEFRKIEIKELPPERNEIRLVFDERKGEGVLEIPDELTTNDPVQVQGLIRKRLKENPKLIVVLDVGPGVDLSSERQAESFRLVQQGVAATGATVKLAPRLVNLSEAALALARKKAIRMNDMKQIGIALLSYHDLHQSLPPTKQNVKAFDAEGRPYLSWRVHILPFIEQEELYKQFKFDEPWDSEHNKKLLAQIPPQFKTADDPTKTTLLAVVGKGTAYEGKAGLTLNDISSADGASNTAYLVDAGPEKAVPWTKPDDLPFDSEDPIRAFGKSDFGSVFLALMTDGAVKSVPRDVAPESLRALFTRNGMDTFDENAKRKTPLPTKHLVPLALEIRNGTQTVQLAGKPVAQNEFIERVKALLILDPTAVLRLELGEGVDLSVPSHALSVEFLRSAVVNAGGMFEVPAPLRVTFDKLERQSLQRAERAKLLRQIGLAMHAHHDSRKKFPPADGFDMQVRPRLSWRVHLLPYLGHEKLYKQFHFDEPWDSEHNKTLLNQMPAVFKTTDDASKTTMQTVVGKGSAYEGKAGFSINADFPDGTSNTALVIDAGPDKAVPWTKPDDLPFAAEDPMRAFGTSEFGGVFVVLMADGAVRFVPRDMSAASLRALLTRSAGDRFEESPKWEVSRPKPNEPSKP